MFVPRDPQEVVHQVFMRTLRSVEVRVQMTDLVKLAWLRGPSHGFPSLWRRCSSRSPRPAAAPLGALYQPGDFVITQGEDGDTFYIVSEAKHS